MPKSTVSQLAESLRIMQKDNTNSNGPNNDNAELSKQEDNILKIFNTGGSAGTKLGDLFFLGFITIIIFVLEVICIVFICQLVNVEIDILLQHSPQIIYVLEQYASLMNTVHTLDLTAAMDSDNPIPIFTQTELLEQLSQLLNKTTSYYTNVRYGTDQLQPYDGYQDGIDYSVEMSLCNDTNNEEFDMDLISTSFRDNVECCNADLVYTSLLAFIQFSVINRTSHITNGKIEPKNEIFNDLSNAFRYKNFNRFEYEITKEFYLRYHHRFDDSGGYISIDFLHKDLEN